MRLDIFWLDSLVTEKPRKRRQHAEYGLLHRRRRICENDDIREFLRDHIPAIVDAPIDFTEVCLYTVEPEERFLVDFLPGRDDVIVASPCSGHGFKFSCLIGRVLADLAAAGGTKIGIEPWRFNRPAESPERRGS